MALSVAPSSGEAPYVFTAEFGNKTAADNITYSIEAAGIAAAEACPLDLDYVPLNSVITTAFRNGDVYTRNTNIPLTNCYSLVVRIRDLRSNLIVQSRVVSVNNI